MTQDRPSPAQPLLNRAAIVIGAGSRGPGIGNGRAISIELARRGADVLLVDVEEAWARETERLIRDEGRRASIAIADVTIPAECKSVIDAAAKEHGRLDILVNSVGIIGARGTAVDVDPDEWDVGMSVNVKSFMLTSKYAIPHMVASGGGSIVNISSVSGMRGGHPNLLYPTSKGAIIAMTRAMAAHHGKQGIRVNCVAPGMVYTPMVAARGVSERAREARRLATLLQTEGTAWDVAGAVCFLAGEDAKWVTGIVLPVDAGASAADVSKPSPA